ncbi:MAG: ABC transporter ATP-binding protein [Gammaproteobacteria bacterium]|nr:ABC transporter ATP-binding protein [Gammaproteobacteria bacterium]
MTNALVVKNLRKRYKGGVEALQGISFEVKKGDFFALLGPNGAGKSTAIGIISSLVNKTEGEVKIFGNDIDTSLSKAKQELGLVPQEFNFNQFETVYNILITQAGYYGIPVSKAKLNTEKYLRALGLWEKRDSPSRMLSGGMKRRLMIARALIHEPKLLILDEPTAGVDIELRRTMWTFLEELNQQGTTIILTTHYLEEAENLCKNIAIIDNGKIISNTSMVSLLKQLNVETLVLDVEEPLIEAPVLQGYACIRVDDYTLNVDVDKSCGVNRLFALLTEQGIKVTSMRNKSNRLEELFISLVNNSELP